MLSFENVTIRQGDFSLAANWQAAAGGRIAVIGPSGAGKSTLLNAVAGFIPLKSGHIRWDGQPLDGLPPGKRPLSILFQDQNLFPHLTVAQNLGLGLDPSLRHVNTAAVDRALERVGLEGLGNRRPAALSGGQQSRAALARALLRARPMLLLDEPFAALGPALKAEMLALVEELAGPALVLMVTHDPEDAQRFSTHTVLVADGIAASPAPTDALFANPPPALVNYLGA
ncbi:ATP-binding cassette domain-containing protein [Gemmobacter lutimaris]|uniref:ATP-binding cassette domain-containing protein n=1 Tax=Gemmobacter lutimaris TaxID=2306023 RepID=A0A398BVT8_9RHOB|nr:ATP-binding cassette domain-containing protein [Gemmobacter lutimaris]RID92588.1 ATP-binding cassette domain-containing protein [Gemmobacter lutimaris]